MYNLNLFRIIFLLGVLSAEQCCVDMYGDIATRWLFGPSIWYTLCWNLVCRANARW